MIACGYCGIKLRNELLGISEQMAKDFHNAVHQREAIRKVAGELEELAAELVDGGPVNHAALSAKLETLAGHLLRIDYV